jgi:hypothetical protein
LNNYAPVVKRMLKSRGCFFVRQGKGDHEIWESTITGVRFPVESTIKTRHTANGIMKLAGIDHRF